MTGWVAALWLPTMAWAQEGRPAELLDDLLSEGIHVSQGQHISVSPPILDPRDEDADVSAVAPRLAGSAGWGRFSRNSVVAPIHMDLKYLRTSDGTRLGQRMHIAFIVHAGIETLRDADVMRRLLSEEDPEPKQPDGFHSAAIDPETLSDLGIEDTQASSYSWLEFVLLKKIELQGVIRSQRNDGDRFFVISWALDEEFTDRDPPHDQYRNQWAKRDRDELGKTALGEPSGYSGAGGYLVVSDVDGVEGASLIEAEIVFLEPTEWFSGSNLLRSKLPLIIQESVRRFRRGLTK